MQYTIREMVEKHGRSLESTDYINSNPTMLDFRLISGDHYDWNTLRGEGGRLRFKESVDVLDYDQVVTEFPAFSAVKYKSREIFPYFADNLDLLNKAVNNGETVAVEGGPCLFGAHEVDVLVYTDDGKVHKFDYACGKIYLNDSSFSASNDSDTLAQFVLRNGTHVVKIDFEQHKKDLTSQEYLQLRYPFEIASALKGPLVIPLPDMSYRKYLVATLETVSDEIRRKALSDFDEILKNIDGFYLNEIDLLQKHFQIKDFACLYLETVDWLDVWYEKRVKYIDKIRFLKSLTKRKESLESIKDYVTMPALPFYLFGSEYILQVDNVDETDSYRKCKRQHKSAFKMGCILTPELLSKNDVDIVYNAPLEFKNYGVYERVV